jgi:hypothetical protein
VVDDAVLEREGAEAVELVAPKVDLRRVLRRAEVEAGAGRSLRLRERGKVKVKVAPRGRWLL